MAIGRPEEFLNAIKECSTIREVAVKAREERKYLRAHYNTIASLKRNYTIYRNYLRANVPADQKKDGKLLLGTLLKILRLFPREQREFDAATKVDIKHDKSNLRLIHDPKGYITAAIEMLSARSYIDKILALSALTGRRVAEIGCSAEFKFIDDYNLEFCGQLKTKDRADVVPYEIPVLYDSNKIIQALQYIRVAKPQFIGNTTLFHDAASKELTKRVRKHFTGFFEGEPKVKDLRAIYALLSFTKFRQADKINKKVDRDVYFSRILGHAENDITTYSSYVDFYIDEN